MRSIGLVNLYCIILQYFCLTYAPRSGLVERHQQPESSSLDLPPAPCSKRALLIQQNSYIKEQQLLIIRGCRLIHNSAKKQRNMPKQPQKPLQRQ